VKKLLAIVIGFAFLAGSATSVRAADIPDEQWSVMTGLMEKTADRTGVVLLGISIEDNSNLSERASNLVGRDSKISGDLGLRICPTDESEFCAPGQAQRLYAILPVCQSQADINCIVAVTAIKNGTQIKGEYKRNFPERGYTDFPASKDRNIPEGSTPSIWTFAGLTHSGGTSEYLVNFGVEANFNGRASAEFNAYNANINPVSIKAGRWARNEVRDASNKTAPCLKNCGMELLGHSYEDKFICASLDEGFCAMRERFPSDVRFKFTVRLSQSPTGWLHGRLKAPNIEIKPISSGVSISIEAEPVSVPVVGLLEAKSSLPVDLVTKYQDLPSFVWSTNNSDPADSNHLLMYQPDNQQAFDALIDWKDFIKDKANASPTQWSVRSLNAPGNSAACFKDSNELIGIVTTNSMVYLGTPPIFNKESQSLDYKVASPHFTSKGEVFKGTYDLQLKSDVARCLYGFSNAPISAKISIISESGEANVATTVVNERDGWMRMAAYGFTFSAPTVKVQLTQEVAKPTATPLATSEEKPSASAAAPIKKSIICAKGKKIKKVTSNAPKCPAGYKRKAA
jgi:hypothetical protein